MSEVQTALLGALRDLQHPGDDRTAVVRQTDAELHRPGVYHHGDADRHRLRRRLGGGPQAHPCRSPADFGGWRHYPLHPEQRTVTSAHGALTALADRHAAYHLIHDSKFTSVAAAGSQDR